VYYSGKDGNVYCQKVNDAGATYCSRGVLGVLEMMRVKKTFVNFPVEKEFYDCMLQTHQHKHKKKI